MRFMFNYHRKEATINLSIGNDCGSWFASVGLLFWTLYAEFTPEG